MGYVHKKEKLKYRLRITIQKDTAFPSSKVLESRVTLKY